MQRILITGASGFVGGHLVPYLRKTRPDIELHNLDLEPSGLESITDHIGALEDPDTYASIPAVDAIIHLAAVSREPGYLVQRYYEVNRHGTSVLADWAERQSVPKLVFYSSISVYGPCERPTAEDAATCPETPYGMSKLLGEQELDDWQERTNSSLAVIRPGVIFGEGDDGNFPRLAKAVQQGWFVFPGRKDTRKAAVYVKDVVELTNWLLDYEFDRLTVNAVYDQASTVEEIVTYIREATGTDRTRTITVPEGLARAAVSTLGIAQAHKPPVERTFHPRRVDKLVTSSNVVSRVLPTIPFSMSRDMRGAVKAWLA